MRARFSKPVAAVAITAALVVGATSVVGASVDAKGSKKKFCNQALNLGSDITQSPDPSSLSEETAADLEKAFKKLAKAAPNNALKNASTTMANFYGELADGGDARDIDSDDAKAFAKATAKFGTYLATKCVSEAIPDITLPDITLP